MRQREARYLLEMIRPMLLNALQHFRGTVISGGTKSGIPGCVGEIAATLQSQGKKQFQLVGYIPTHVPADAPPDDRRYDKIVKVEGERGFSPSQILQMWEDLCRDGISPSQVTLLGFGGGSMTAVEYRVAFALGATVAAVAGTDGASDEILADPVWSAPPSILPLPFDAASIQALTTRPTHAYKPEELIEMAQAFHENFLKGNIGRLAENLRPWGKLPATYQKANVEQARYAVEILRASGFDVCPANGVPQIFEGFEPEEIERMAELEHGRWVVERLRNGWRPGRERNDAARIHDCIVAWKELPDHIREYDRIGVRAFPEILAKAGLEVFRK